MRNELNFSDTFKCSSSTMSKNVIRLNLAKTRHSVVFREVNEVFLQTGSTYFR